MELIIPYIILILTGVGCVAFTIYEHKKCKQKNIDTELYNQNLETTKGWLEKETQQLEKQRNSLKEEIDNKMHEQAKISQQKKQEYEDLCKKEKATKNTINDLDKQQKKIQNTINDLNEKWKKIKDDLAQSDKEKARAQVMVEQLQRQEAQTAARIDSLNKTISETFKKQQETLNKSFTSYCEALDDSYKNKEQEYDELLSALELIFEEKQQEAIAAFEKTKEVYNVQLEQEKVELDKIRATRIAAQEALLREEEIRKNREFFTLSIDRGNEHDLKILKSITSQLTNARPVLMAIWETFYRKSANDLAARVLKAEKVAGIYKITHIDSGLCYIGQARDIKERWREHIKCGLGIDVKTYQNLYSDMLRYGIEAFTFELLEECPIAQLDEKEAYYIQLYDSYNYGYNGTRGNKK